MMGLTTSHHLLFNILLMVHYSGRVEDIVTMNYLEFMESSKTKGLENSRKAKMADAHNTPGSKLPPLL